MRMHGTIKWFNDAKGYGFITADDGEEVFLHFTGIAKEGYKTIKDGAKVTYQVKDTDKGLCALDVHEDEE